MSLIQMIEDTEYRSLLIEASAADFLHGALELYEGDFGWKQPARFLSVQQHALGSCQAWHPGLYRQMGRTSAGICLEFETDSHEVALELRVEPLWDGIKTLVASAAMDNENYDGVSCEVDGRWLSPSWGKPRIPTAEELAPIEDSVDEKATKRQLRFDPGRLVSFVLSDSATAPATGLRALPGLGKTHHVRLWLPCLYAVEIRRLFGDGTYLKAVDMRPVLLVMGDAATQGLAVGDPARTWSARLARSNAWDLLNQGVVGQVFQPGMAASLYEAKLSLAGIVVSFGESLRHEPCQEREVARNVRAFLAEIARVWPHTPCWVLTPFWHDEESSPTHPRSCFGSLSFMLEANVAAHDQMRLVNGCELMEGRLRALGGNSGLPGDAAHRSIARRLEAIFHTY
ncbi:hypothetical protein [uncultured Olegusella sp.]|uniref:hypothetical protein n=1 Tax=uncultured Olegusella sp. TaxID=1979846 RepID=UPI00262BB82F|nr:hypothetical protein [uncultured Olegusella sp.]